MNDQALATLREILRWIRASSFPNVQQMLRQALPAIRDRIAYQALHGDYTIKDVQSSAGMGHKGLHELIDRCVAMGLMERDDKGRAARVFDLHDFGLAPAPSEKGESVSDA